MLTILLSIDMKITDGQIENQKAVQQNVHKKKKN